MESLPHSSAEHVLEAIQWRQKRQLIAYACGAWCVVTLIVLLLAPYWRGWGYPLAAFYSVVLGLPIFYLMLIYGFNQQVAKLSKQHAKTS